MAHSHYRTPTKAYGNLTREEELAIGRHIEAWIARAFRTAPIEPSRIVPAIAEIYRAAGFKPPRTVIVPSPLAAAYVYGAAAAHWHRENYSAAQVDLGVYAVNRVQADSKIKQRVYDPAQVATGKATQTLGFDPWQDKEGEERPRVKQARHMVGDRIRHFVNQAVSPAINAGITQGLNRAIAKEHETIARDTRKMRTECTEKLGRPRSLVIDATFAATRSAIENLGKEVHLACLEGVSPKVNSFHNSMVAGVAAAVRDGTTTFELTDGLEFEYARDCFELAGALGLALAREWHHAAQGGNTWAAYEAFISAMRDVIGLRLPEHQAYAAWEEAAIEGGYRLVHDEFCVVSDFPLIVKTDPEHRPHCDDGPSHVWRDGWALYHWHGVPVPGRWLERKEELTAAEALSWENIEQRRAACEILGWARILTDLKARVIDADGDPQIGTLVEVDLPGLETIGVGQFEKVRARFLRVLCGTGREFAICVPPKTATAIEAQAWMLGLSQENFLKPEIRA